MFACKICFKSQTIETAAKGYINKNGYCKCKQCRSNEMKHRIAEKLADIKPDDYLCCNDCDRIFSKYIGRKPDFGRRKELENCKYCYSENVETL
jgi:hypothetical protein